MSIVESIGNIDRDRPAPKGEEGLYDTVGNTINDVWQSAKDAVGNSVDYVSSLILPDTKIVEQKPPEKSKEELELEARIDEAMAKTRAEWLAKQEAEAKEKAARGETDIAPEAPAKIEEPAPEYKPKKEHEPPRHYSVCHMISGVNLCAS